MEDMTGRYKSALLARFASVPTDDPSAGLRAFVEFSAQTPELHRIMTQQSTQRSDRLDWLLDNYLKQSFKKVCDLIRAGQKARLVRAGDLYYAVIGLAGTLFSVSREFQLLTKRDVFAPEAVRATIEMIFEFLFINGERWHTEICCEKASTRSPRKGEVSVVSNTPLFTLRQEVVSTRSPIQPGVNRC